MGAQGADDDGDDDDNNNSSNTVVGLNNNAGKSAAASNLLIPYLTPLHARGFSVNRDNPSQCVGYTSDHTIAYPIGAVLTLRGQQQMRFSTPIASVKAILALAVSANLHHIAVCERVQGHAQICIMDARTLKRVKLLTAQSVGDFAACAWSAGDADVAGVTDCEGAENSNKLHAYALDKAKMLGSTLVGTRATAVSINPQASHQYCLTGPSLFRLIQFKDSVWRDLPVAGINSPNTATNTNKSLNDSISKHTHMEFTSHAWLPRGGLVVGTSRSGILVVVNRSVAQRLEAMGPVMTIAPTSKGFMTGGVAGQLCTYTCQQEHEQTYALAETSDAQCDGAINCIVVSPSEVTAACAIEGQGLLYYSLTQTSFNPLAIGSFSPAASDHHRVDGSGMAGIVGMDACAARSLLVTAGGDGSVRLWDYEEMTCEAMYQSPLDVPLCVGISSFGYNLAVGFPLKLAVFLILADGLSLAHEIPMKSVNEVRFAPGSHVVAAACGRDIHLLSSLTWTITSTLRGHPRPVRALCWSVDGLHLASAGIDGTLYGWEVSAVGGRKVEENCVKGSSYSGLVYARDRSGLIAAGAGVPLRVVDTMVSQGNQHKSGKSAAVPGGGTANIISSINNAVTAGESDVYRANIVMEGATHAHTDVPLGPAGDLSARILGVSVSALALSASKSALLLGTGENTSTSGGGPQQQQQEDPRGKSTTRSSRGELPPPPQSSSPQQQQQPHYNRPGALVIRQWPLGAADTSIDGVGRWYCYHTAAVTKVCISADGRLVFSAGADGCLFVFVLTDHPEEKPRVRDPLSSSSTSDLDPSRSSSNGPLVLLFRSTFQSQLAEIRELKSTVERMTLGADYRLHRTEQEWGNKAKLAQDEYEAKLEKLKKQVAEAQRRANFQAIEFERITAREVEDRANERDAIEAKANARLAKELERTDSFASELSLVREQLDQERADHLARVENLVEESRLEHEALEAAHQESMRSLMQEMQEMEHGYDVGARVENELHEEEMLRVTTYSRAEVARASGGAEAARSGFLYWRTTAAKLEARLKDAARKEKEDEAERKGLEGRVAELSKALQVESDRVLQRDLLLESHDDRIASLVRQIRDFETFKALREQQILKLKGGQAPVVEALEKQRGRVKELENNLNDAIEAQSKQTEAIKHLNARVAGADAEIGRLRTRASERQRRLELVLGEIGTIVREQDPSEWSSSLRSLYRTYVTSDSRSSQHRASSQHSSTHPHPNAVAEFQSQRLALERFVVLLRKSKVVSEGINRKDKVRMYKENSELLGEIHQMKKQNKEMWEVMTELQSELLRERNRAFLARNASSTSPTRSRSPSPESPMSPSPDQAQEEQLQQQHSRRSMSVTGLSRTPSPLPMRPESTPPTHRPFPPSLPISPHRASSSSHDPALRAALAENRARVEAQQTHIQRLEYTLSRLLNNSRGASPTLGIELTSASPLTSEASGSSSLPPRPRTQASFGKSSSCNSNGRIRAISAKKRAAGRAKAAPHWGAQPGVSMGEPIAASGGWETIEDTHGTDPFSIREVVMAKRAALEGGS